jgi:threonine/homoserine/homoserine lactone efflux protein
VAALGLRAIAHAILGVQHWIQLGGAGFLLWLGVQTWRQPVQEPGNPIRPATGRAAAFGSVFLLTMANPVTILSFAAVFSGLGASTENFDSAPALVAGVFLGSALWWLLLSILADALRQRLAGSARRWVNRLAGTCLVAIAAWILIGLRAA